jgi:hypothetical protein
MKKINDNNARPFALRKQTITNLQSVTGGDVPLPSVSSAITWRINCHVPISTDCQAYKRINFKAFKA